MLVLVLRKKGKGKGKGATETLSLSVLQASSGKRQALEGWMVACGAQTAVYLRTYLWR